MANKHWTILILLIFMMGCSAQRQSTTIVKRERKFFTPDNWQQPIKTQSSGQPVATSDATSSTTVVTPNTVSDNIVAQPSTQVKNQQFKPDFSRPVTKILASVNPKTTKNNDGFRPDFANSAKPLPASTSAASVSGGSREQMDGYASWYGPGFHGKKTANGERYNQNQMTAAHRILPMNTWVQVHNLDNNRIAVVRINDRGPYKKNRIIDLTRKAAESLKFKDKGTARVSLKILQYPKNYDPSKGLDPYKQVVVQIAVFRGEQRAHNFKNQLSRRYDHIPFLIDDHKKKAFHVIAGPYEKRTQAIKIAKALKADGIDNFVRSYRK